MSMWVLFKDGPENKYEPFLKYSSYNTQYSLQVLLIVSQWCWHKETEVNNQSDWKYLELAASIQQNKYGDSLFEHSKHIQFTAGLNIWFQK